MKINFSVGFISIISLINMLEIYLIISKHNLSESLMICRIAETFPNFPIFDLHLDWIFDLDEIKETGS
jgi:hypothetical protein